MNRIPVLLILAWLAFPAQADLVVPPRSGVAVTDPTQIVEDRGSKLEVFPTKRAAPVVNRAGRVTAHRVARASANTRLTPGSLGVIFNHTLQKQGYISGEISFKLKNAALAAELPPGSYPGLKRIVEPDIYVVNARTPLEFIAVLKRLQQNPDVAWAEPTITYGPAATDSGAAAGKSNN